MLFLVCQQRSSKVTVTLASALSFPEIQKSMISVCIV
uniref:Uncharacterized protein n=1 Tax=Anguilla anguilla TaxID=7936 RepID=A0A0E9S0Y7_ANGAN